MVDISITATTRRAQFTGNTGLGPFAFTFNVLDESDVTVIKNSTELVVATDYTVTVNADGTGSVTLTGSGNGTALISSDVLTILGDRPLSRTSDYTQGGNLFASAINEDLDSLVIGLQQVDEKIDRSLRIQPGDEFIDLTLPLRADRANNYLAFDASGDPVVVAGTTSTLVVTAFAETLLDDSSAPAMLNTLGLSATAAEINLLDGVTWTPTDFNALTATPAELNIMDGGTSATATTLVDADRVVVNDAGTMVQVAMSDVSAYTFGSLSIDEDDMASDTATKLPTQQSVKAYVDSKEWVESTVTATTSGTAFDFTSLPAGITEIEVMLYRVSLSDNDDLIVQIGTGGSPTTSGYLSYSGGSSSTAGLAIRNSSGSAQNSAIMHIVRYNGNDWVSSHGVATGNTGEGGGGSVSLAGELDNLRLTRTGTNTFDAGSFKIRYR